MLKNDNYITIGFLTFQTNNFSTGSTLKMNKKVIVEFDLNAQNNPIANVKAGISIANVNNIGCFLAVVDARHVR